jgi:hypothetical protein
MVINFTNINKMNNDLSLNTKTSQHVMLEIQLLASGRHKNVAGVKPVDGI